MWDVYRSFVCIMYAHTHHSLTQPSHSTAQNQTKSLKLTNRIYSIIIIQPQTIIAN